MNHSTRVFPAFPTQLTNQALVSHAGLSVMTSFLNALDFRQLCEDRFRQFVPATATLRPGKFLGARPYPWQLAASKRQTLTSCAQHQNCSDS